MQKILICTTIQGFLLFFLVGERGRRRAAQKNSVISSKLMECSKNYKDILNN